MLQPKPARVERSVAASSLKGSTANAWRDRTAWSPPVHSLARSMRMTETASPALQRAGPGAFHARVKPSQFTAIGPCSRCHCAHCSYNNQQMSLAATRGRPRSCKCGRAGNRRSCSTSSGCSSGRSCTHLVQLGGISASAQQLAHHQDVPPCGRQVQRRVARLRRDHGMASPCRCHRCKRILGSWR
jgi:hypothetical protein